MSFLMSPLDHCQRNSSVFTEHLSMNILSKAFGENGIIYSHVTVGKAFDKEERKEIVKYISK